MKIKLLAAFNAGTEEEPNVLPAESVIEVSAEVGDQMVADGLAIEYTEEEEAVEEEAAAPELKAMVLAKAKAIKLDQKTAHTVIVQENKMNVFGKAIKDVMESKATGMSGSAAVSGTDATDVLGVIAADSVIYGKCRKVPVSGNLNIVYSKAATESADSVPVMLPTIGLTGEGTAGATTVPLAQYSAIPGKWFATVAVTTELLEDVPSLEAFVIAELRTQLGIALDNSALNGAFTNSIGLKGVIDDTNALQADIANFEKPTIPELTAMIAMVNPMLHPSCEWYINPAFWSTLEGELLTANNVSNQLIKTGKEKELLGFPVNISFAVPEDNPAVFGDFGKYVIGERKAIEIERDDSVLFNTDEVMLKIRVRLAGGLAAGVRTYEDADYAAIVYAGEATS